MDREIPVIADAYVDREFGTGVVKITPAHDPNDFEVGKRHHLPEIEVLTDDAHMNAAAGKYAGLERFVARARIIEDLQKLGLIERITEHTHSIGTCDRCKSIVEPKVSTQWFCKMKPLAEPAKKTVLDSLIEVVPDNQRTILLQWLENIRDWCISRQLWWGHRIPIWHCANCKEMVPALDSRVEIVEGQARAASVPTKCPKCGGATLEQDKDVLDTWFSSALWPFSTLGWPDDTPDLRAFYPTSLLISGYDILFFWDARMIMMGLHLTGRAAVEDRIPFRRLYLHSLVRLTGGEKMSKTKGTGVDPLQMTQQYGTDALRFMLVSMAAPGTDIILSEDRILSARAFANKIWNAARFLFFNLEKIEAQGVTIDELASPKIRARAPYLVEGKLGLFHRWIFSRLSRVAGEANTALEQFRFHEACHNIYQFFWADFCDWYIEEVKPQLLDPNRDVSLAAWRNIFAAFEAALRLLHPVMPFLTEELWHRIPQPTGAHSIALDTFPRARPDWIDPEAERDVIVFQNAAAKIREARADAKIDPKKWHPVEVYASTELGKSFINDYQAMLQTTTASAINVLYGHLNPLGGVVRSNEDLEFKVSFDQDVDKVGEVARLKKEIERLAKDIETKQARLTDESFLSKAPAKIVEELRATLAARKVEHQKLLDRLRQFES